MQQLEARRRIQLSGGASPFAQTGRLKWSAGGCDPPPFRSMAYADDPTPRPRSKLLFVCRTHSVVSLMAEGLARAAFAQLDISAHSAGLSRRPLDP